MKKIGIATPYKVANYGTKLQAFAISNYLDKLYEGGAEIINYTPSNDHRLLTIMRKLFSIKRNIARMNRLVSKRDICKVIDEELCKQRTKSINAFDSVFKLSRPINSWNDLKNVAEQYDCVVCGSDQIWIPDNLADQYYTLEFCNKEIKKGAYAASLGVDTLTIKQKRKYTKFLNKLDFVSVREEVGKEVLNSFYKKNIVEWVCDPTFLIAKDVWSDMECCPKIMDSISKKYVFCYFLGTDEGHRRAVYEYAREKDYLILSIANFKGYCEADTSLTDVQLYDLSVNEFLYLIHHAEMVCTDSMHATIFSVIFEKDFVTFERFKNTDSNSRNSRIYSLLKVLGLEERLVGNGIIVSEPIDYVKTQKLKEAYIDRSIRFIEEEII